MLLFGTEGNIPRRKKTTNTQSLSIFCVAITFISPCIEGKLKILFLNFAIAILITENYNTTLEKVMKEHSLFEHILELVKRGKKDAVLR